MKLVAQEDRIEFRAGMFVKCIHPVHFIDGSQHDVGEMIEVKEDEIAYFSLFTGRGGNYKLS